MNKKSEQYFELCNKVCQKIAETFGGNTAAGKYPPVERTVVLTWTAAGIIENGGFRYLFGSVLPGDPHCSMAIEAFKEIHCIKAADALERAICLFPDCTPHEDTAERIIWYEAQAENLRAQLDSDFWNELDNITKCLGIYIVKYGLDQKYGHHGPEN